MASRKFLKFFWKIVFENRCFWMKSIERGIIELVRLEVIYKTPRRGRKQETSVQKIREFSEAERKNKYKRHKQRKAHALNQTQREFLGTESRPGRGLANIKWQEHSFLTFNTFKKAKSTQLGGNAPHLVINLNHKKDLFYFFRFSVKPLMIKMVYHL